MKLFNTVNDFNTKNHITVFHRYFLLPVEYFSFLLDVFFS